MNIGRMYLWIAALRTRKFTCPACGQERTYSQARGTMEANYVNGTKAQCCLGVAAYVAKDNGCEVTIDPPQHPFVGNEQRPTYFNTITNFMPDTVTHWFGLEHGNPFIPLLGDSAAACNDGGYTFDDIAEGLEDMVRRELKLTPLTLPERRQCVMTRWASIADSVETAHTKRLDEPCTVMTLPGSNKCLRHGGTAYDTWDQDGNLIAYSNVFEEGLQSDDDVASVAEATGETPETVQSVQDAMKAVDEEGTWD